MRNHPTKMIAPAADQRWASMWRSSLRRAKVTDGMATAMVRSNQVERDGRPWAVL